MLHGDRDGGIAIERWATGEHLVHDDAEGIDIGCRIDDFTLCLLRGVVLHRSERHTGSGQAFRVDVLVDTGDTEIGELDGTIAPHQDTLWFDVTMNNATAMSGP